MLCAKVVCHARRVYLKLSPEQATLMKTLLAALAAPAGAPATVAQRTLVTLPGTLYFTPRTPGGPVPLPVLLAWPR